MTFFSSIIQRMNNCSSNSFCGKLGSNECDGTRGVATSATHEPPRRPSHCAQTGLCNAGGLTGEAASPHPDSIRAESMLRGYGGNPKCRGLGTAEPSIDTRAKPASEALPQHPPSDLGSIRGNLIEPTTLGMHRPPSENPHDNAAVPRDRTRKPEERVDRKSSRHPDTWGPKDPYRD